MTDECGRPERECVPGVLASYLGPAAIKEIKRLTDQHDRARSRLAHYASALTKVWELLDDVCHSEESEDDGLLIRKLPENVYSEAVVMRRSIGLLLQGEPWDGDNDPIQELLTMRRELGKDDGAAR